MLVHVIKVHVEEQMRIMIIHGCRIVSARSHELGTSIHNERKKENIHEEIVVKCIKTRVSERDAHS